MRFERLRLSGFKSFVEPTELRIEPGLTGIVGPNGCGKSNLLEAMRWAMGEGSAKSLRGGGMEDVIFAGTTGRAARDFAEVTIAIDNSDRATGSVIDEDRIEVTRRIERGAGSAYRLNGRDVRQKDVALLFADAATGAHSPALVSQGRVGAIISARPQERRLLLEEAAGISGLHVRRKDAEQRLRGTEANLMRLDDMLGELENQANMLRRQARAAERYRKLSEGIARAEAMLVFARWREADQAAARALREAESAEAVVRERGEAHRAAAAAQSDAAASLSAARTAEMQARDELGRVLADVETLEAERARHDERVRELDAAAAALARDRAREQALVADAGNALARLDAERAALEARIADGRARLAGFAPRVTTAEAAVDVAERELALAIEQQATTQAGYRVAEAALRAAEDQLRRTGADLARLDSEAARLAAEAGAGEDSTGLEAALADVEADIVGLRQRIVAADAAREAAEADRARETAAHGEAAARARALESERAAVARMAALPESARRSALASIRPAPGYERALAAALGDDLDAAVGDADAARSWRGAALAGDDPPLPAGVESLAANVDAPAELARRLAQIGVVDADDGGIALAIGQRLVTRDGRLRRWDGFAASGSGQAAAERLLQANRLVAIEAALPAAQAEVDSRQQGLAAAHAAHAEARREEGEARAALDRAERDRRTLETRLSAARAAAERLQGRVAAVAEQLGAARGAAAVAQSARDAAAAALAGLPNPDGSAQASADARRSADAARAALAAIRAEDGQLRRQIDGDGDRLDAVRREIDGWQARAADADRREEELNSRDGALGEQRAALAEAPVRFAARAQSLSERAQQGRIAATAAAERLRAAEIAAQFATTALEAIAESVSDAREKRAGAVARAENQELRRVEMGRVSGERFECPPPLLPGRIGFDEGELGDVAECSARFERLTLDRERLGPVNLVAEHELAELDQRHATTVAERDELTQAIHRLRGSIGSLNREGRARLLTAFEAVDAHFRTLFTTLFVGGQAHLALIESDDPLEAGLEIMAQPPGKKLASLTLLSGGEQALTAIALIFALFLTNPAPICVLDEVDAPLDDANVERFCDLLDRMAGDIDTRFMIVTHNAVTMSRMHRLYGVTMVERGISRLVSVDLRAAETLLAAE
jgi:chromosome segregation protein